MLLVQGILGQLFLVFSILQLPARGYDQSLVGNFTNPPNEGSDLTYQRGSLIELSWHSNLERIGLRLWDLTGNGSEILPSAANITNTNSLPWIVQSTKDISINVFFFLIYRPGDTDPLIGSNTFRITDTSATSTTVATSSSSTLTFAVITSTTFVVITSTPSALTPIATSSSSTSTFSAASEDPSATQPLQATSSSGSATNSRLSTGAKVGTGIGVGVGITVLGTLANYLWG